MIASFFFATEMAFLWERGGINDCVFFFATEMAFLWERAGMNDHVFFFATEMAFLWERGICGTFLYVYNVFWGTH
jgi:hypothetical protein